MIVERQSLRDVHLSVVRWLLENLDLNAEPRFSTAEQNSF